MFGWTEGDNTGETGNPLILYTGEFAQFVYLLPGDTVHADAGTRPLRIAGRDDRRSSRPIVERARTAHAEPTTACRSSTCTPARPTAPTHDYTLTSAYIGFVLPLMVELQHLERHERLDS